MKTPLSPATVMISESMATLRRINRKGNQSYKKSMCNINTTTIIPPQAPCPGAILKSNELD